MTTTPFLEETQNTTKTLNVSDAAQVLTQWNTYLVHAASSYDQLDAGSSVLKALARENHAASTYTSTWEYYYAGISSELDHCCALMEVLALLSKARRSWDMVETRLSTQPQPHTTYYIHEQWYLDHLLKGCRAAIRSLAERTKQISDELRPLAERNRIALDSGFWYSVRTSEL